MFLFNRMQMNLKTLQLLIQDSLKIQNQLKEVISLVGRNVFDRRID